MGILYCVVIPGIISVFYFSGAIKAEISESREDGKNDGTKATIMVQKTKCTRSEPCLFRVAARSPTTGHWIYKDLPTWCSCPRGKICEFSHLNHRKRASVHKCHDSEDLAELVEWALN